MLKYEQLPTLIRALTRIGKILRACQACCRVCGFLYIGGRLCSASALASGLFEAAPMTNAAWQGMARHGKAWQGPPAAISWVGHAQCPHASNAQLAGIPSRALGTGTAEQILGTEIEIANDQCLARPTCCPHAHLVDQQPILISCQLG